MLRIEEIVGAMDDEFRYALEAYDDDQLARLATDKAALRRLRPVGVSHAEALAMIAAIQEQRAARSRAQARKQTRHRVAGPRRAHRQRMLPPSEVAVEPQAVAPQDREPAILPPPPRPPRLGAPQAHGPAIRLPGPPVDGTTIILPPPPAPKPTPWEQPAPEATGDEVPDRARPTDQREPRSASGHWLALAAVAATLSLAAALVLLAWAQ